MPLPDPLGLLTLFAIAAALVVLLGAAILVGAMWYPPRKTYAVALGRGLPTHPEGTMPHGGREVTLTLADGRETPGFLIGGDRPDGPTVVIVHGFGDSRYGAMTWAPLVIPHAREVLVYDLRGHGESETRHADMVVGDERDLRRILEELDAPNGVVLFGYSLGAVVAIGAASGPLAPRERAGVALAGGEGAAPRIRGVIADGPYRTWVEPVKRHLWRRRFPAQPFTALAWLVVNLTTRGLGFDRAADAAKLRCPLLVLHGPEDVLCPIASAEAIARAAPDGEIVVIEGGGHLDLAIVDEAKYRAALARFFQRIDDGITHARRPDRPHAAQGGGGAR